ncbi:MAG: FtsH protease activity modulator HflK [Haliea sp.]|nr:FtsH protease activity modulator HflK [Haliea sp.]
MAVEDEVPSSDQTATRADTRDSTLILATRFFKRWVFRAVSSIQRFFYGFIFATERILTYISTAVIGSARSLVNRLSTSKFLRSLFSNVRRVIFLLAFVGISYVVIRATVFIIDYDYDGVILRVGAYHRTVTPGMNFKIPVIEKLFVVNTEDRRQEHFGFVQFDPPPSPMTDHERDIREDQDEALLDYNGAQASDLGTGDFLTEIERKGPGLTRDYIIENEVAKQDALHYTDQEAEVQERNERRVSAANHIIPPSGKVPVPEEMKMITGDLNIVYLTYSVQYEIVTPQDYLFNSVDVQSNIRDITQVAIRVAVGDRSTNGVLSFDRKTIADETLKYLQDIVDRYRLGVVVTNVIIQDANPPDQVKAAFHKVNSAKQEMEDIINLAESEYNATLPQMVGKAERVLSEASAYQVNLTLKAAGEAQRFSQVLAEYEKAPEVIRSRYYLEALESLHEKISVTLIDPSLKGILPVFAKQHSQVSPAISAGIPQHASETQMFEVHPEQYQVWNTPIPQEGLHSLPVHGVDPPGVMEPSGNASPGQQNGTEAVTISRPAVTTVDPVSISAPEVRQ